MSLDLRRGALRALLALMLSGAGLASALAQAAYPNKPVRIIVPSTPGASAASVAKLRLPIGRLVTASVAIVKDRSPLCA